MNDQQIINTYLFVSSSKLSISVHNNTETKALFFEELIIDKDSGELDFEILDIFLEKNIFKVEKLIKNFVKSIYLILDCKDFLPVKISIKENNNDNIYSHHNLKNLLELSRDCCKKTLENHRLIHILIDNYQIDQKNFSSLPNQIDCKDFSLDITFIGLSDNIVKNFEIILRKYQISIKKVLNSKYLIEFFEKKESNIFIMAHKIIDGFNQNEVLLVPKIQKNKGFLERFFHFFS